MGEFFFVLKTLVVTSLIVILMQIKVGDRSLESHAYKWLRTSSVSHYIQSVAAGGALALRNLTRSVGDGVSSTIDGFEEGAQEKAIR